MIGFGADVDLFIGSVDIFQIKAGQLTNTNTGLEQEFDNGADAFVTTTSIAKGAVFEFGENSGWGKFDFGMRDVVGWIVLD